MTAMEFEAHQLADQIIGRNLTKSEAAELAREWWGREHRESWELADWASELANAKQKEQS